MKNILHILSCFVLTISLVVISGCGPDPNPNAPVGTDGFYIVNEGAFNNNNASLSFYDRDKDEVTNDVFQAKNGRALGDQAQSMTIHEGKGYIVVQNSGKIEVIDIQNNASLRTITDGIESPRYFIGIDATKGYVSDWGSDGLTGSVKVVDLASMAVTKTIPTGHGPNRFLNIGSRLYIANSGGYGKDNSVKVIDVTKDQVIATIIVRDNPNSLEVDKDGNIWVASSGNLVYNQDYSINESLSTKSALTKLKGSDLGELVKFEFNEFTFSPLSNLVINADRNVVYYNYNGAVYSLATDASQLSSQPFINKSYYGLAVDPITDNVIGTLAPTFSAAGKIEVYGSDGMLKNSYDVGIAPNGCAFK
jgi:YVTN family beta-propeller protein